MAAVEKQKIVPMLVVIGLIAVVVIAITWFILSGIEDKDIVEAGINTEMPTADPADLPSSKVEEYDITSSLIEEEIPVVESTDIAELERKQEEERQKKEKEEAELSSYFAQRQTEAVSQIETLMSSGENNNNTPESQNNSGTPAAVSPQMEEINKREAELKAEQEAALELQKQKIEELRRLTTKDVDENKDTEKENVTDVRPIENKSSNVSVLRRRNEFYGSVATTGVERKTIRATVYGKQVITNGQNVRLRLSEPMQIGGSIIPKSSLITGVGTVGTDRLFISITSVEHNDIIYPVRLEVYDVDGLRGLYVPGSLESDAIRDITQEIAQSVGSTASQAQSTFINNQSATEQIKSDIYRGAVGGTANYINKKLAQIKINIQDGHSVLLML